MKFFALVFGLLLSIPGYSSELDIQFPVTKYKLKNGMRVLLYEDHSAPIISYHVWFNVGSKNETPGQTGLAHLFEHMMFKGTKKYGNKEFDLILQRNGITNNAFTTRDYTGYYEDLPSGKLELVMDIESDRMQNLVVTQEILDSEREVVKEERRYRTENSVMGTLYEGIFSNLYKVHPYRWPVIGYMKDLNQLSVEDCQAFYKKYYSPNNAVLIIGGDINIEKTKALVEKYYGHIPASDLKHKELPKEPAQTRMRRAVIKKDIGSTTVSMNYRGPSGWTSENFDLDVLANIMSSGNSSLLQKALVKKHQIASQVYTFFNSSPEEGSFHIVASLKPGVKAAKARRIIEKEIRNIQRRGVSQEDVQKAINQIQTGYVSTMDTISGKVRALALNELVLGDYTFLFKDLPMYENVTPARVKAVANKYLKKNKLVLVELVPKGKKK